MAHSYKAQLDELNKSLDKCNSIIIDNSKFPIDMFMKFLVDCISFMEDEEYSHTNLVFTQFVILGDSHVANFTPSYLIFDSCFKEDVKKLEKTLIVCHLEHFYRELLDNSKYILGNLSKEVSLLDEQGLIYNFKSFPYLEEIAYSLIDRRLKEPLKPLEEILNDELESIKNVYSKKLRDTQDNF